MKPRHLRHALALIAFAAPQLATAQPTTDPVEEPGPAPLVAPAIAPAADASATPAAPAAPMVAAPPTLASSSDDIDLASLGLDEAGGRQEEHLNIYGFADINYRMGLNGDRSPLHGITRLPKEGAFAVGNVNLYLTRKLSDAWSSFLEIRFMYAPNGNSIGQTNSTPATATDTNDLGRPTTWGSIDIQRAYVEYQAHPLLAIQAGSWLTPYGIWNVDHGSPAIIGTRRPYVIGEKFFPERQTGLQAYGKKGFGDLNVGYHLTLSNGRGPYSDFRDLDDNKAIGGRVFLEAPWGGNLRVGASVLRGKVTRRDDDFLAIDPATGMGSTQEPVGTRSTELSYAADLLFERGPLHVQAEVIVRDFAYEEGARPRTNNTFSADGRAWGGYALAAVNTGLPWSLQVFAADEQWKNANLIEVPRVNTVNAGINLRPTPSVVLKADAADAWFPSNQIPINNAHLRTFSTQVAFVF